MNTRYAVSWGVWHLLVKTLLGSHAGYFTLHPRILISNIKYELSA